MNNNPKQASEKGQALIESAIVIPILLLLSLGIVDASRAFYVQNTLNHIAREEVSKLATDPRLNPNFKAVTGHPDPVGEAEDTAEHNTYDQLAQFPMTNGAAVHITIPTKAELETKPIQITVNQNFDFMSTAMLPDILGMGRVNLSATSSAFIEKTSITSLRLDQIPIPSPDFDGDGVPNHLDPDTECFVSGTHCNQPTSDLICQQFNRARCTPEQLCRLFHEVASCESACQNAETPEAIASSCGNNVEMLCRFHPENATCAQPENSYLLCLYHGHEAAFFRYCTAENRRYVCAYLHSMGDDSRCSPDQLCQLDTQKCQATYCRVFMYMSFNPDTGEYFEQTYGGFCPDGRSCTDGEICETPLQQQCRIFRFPNPRTPDPVLAHDTDPFASCMACRGADGANDAFFCSEGQACGVDRAACTPQQLCTVFRDRAHCDTPCKAAQTPEDINLYCGSTIDALCEYHPETPICTQPENSVWLCLYHGGDLDNFSQYCTQKNMDTICNMFHQRGDDSLCTPDQLCRLNSSTCSGTSCKAPGASVITIGQDESSGPYLQYIHALSLTPTPPTCPDGRVCTVGETCETPLQQQCRVFRFPDARTPDPNIANANVACLACRGADGANDAYYCTDEDWACRTDRSTCTREQLCKNFGWDQTVDNCAGVDRCGIRNQALALEQGQWVINGWLVGVNPLDCSQCDICADSNQRCAIRDVCDNAIQRCQTHRDDNNREHTLQYCGGSDNACLWLAVCEDTTHRCTVRNPVNNPVSPNNNEDCTICGFCSSSIQRCQFRGGAIPPEQLTEEDCTQCGVCRETELCRRDVALCPTDDGGKLRCQLHPDLTNCGNSDNLCLWGNVCENTTQRCTLRNPANDPAGANNNEDCEFCGFCANTIQRCLLRQFVVHHDHADCDQCGYCDPIPPPGDHDAAASPLPPPPPPDDGLENNNGGGGNGGETEENTNPVISTSTATETDTNIGSGSETGTDSATGTDTSSGSETGTGF